MPDAITAPAARSRAAESLAVAAAWLLWGVGSLLALALRKAPAMA
jgi:hypothetical protein